MSSDAQDADSIVMTPSDAIGAVQRGLQETLGYLHANNAMTIDVPGVLAHIERLVPYLMQVQKMQASVQAQASNGAGEARAN